MSKKFLVGIIIFITLSICVWLQINLLNNIPLFGVNANIGLVFVVGIGLLAAKIPGGLTGFAYGFLLDLLYGKSFGLYIAIYSLTGIAAGAMSKGFSKDNKLSMVYMVALFSIVTELVTYLFSVILYGYPIEVSAVSLLLLKETIYNMILARILFSPLTVLAEIINKSKNSYYLL